MCIEIIYLENTPQQRHPFLLLWLRLFSITVTITHTSVTRRRREKKRRLFIFQAFPVSRNKHTRDSIYVNKTDWLLFNRHSFSTRSKSRRVPSRSQWDRPLIDTALNTNLQRVSDAATPWATDVNDVSARHRRSKRLWSCERSHPPTLPISLFFLKSSLVFSSF